MHTNVLDLIRELQCCGEEFARINKDLTSPDSVETRLESIVMRYVEKQKRTRLEFLEKQNRELLEQIANMSKDGYTYDQVNRKMFVCEKCFKEIK